MAEPSKELKDDNQAREDEILRRMLNTPPKPHKDMKGKSGKKQGDDRRQPEDTS